MSAPLSEGETRLVWFETPDRGEEDDAPPFVDDIADWQQAASRLSGPLETAALRLGHLDMLMALSPGRWDRGIALRMAARLSRILDHPATATEIACWCEMHVSTTDEVQARSLAWSGWATNRLSARIPAMRLDPASPDSVITFLGRAAGSAAGDADDVMERFVRARPSTLTDHVSRWSTVMDHATVLSPLVRSAFAVHAWRSCGLVRRHPAGLFEALVLAACLCGSPGRMRDGLPFLPLSPGAVAEGTVHRRLEAFVQDVAQSALDLRRHVEDATAWRERAMQLVTPKRARLADVIRTFLDHDPVSVALVMKRCGLGRTNARRHVMRLEDAGLIRTPGRPGRPRLYARA